MQQYFINQITHTGDIVKLNEEQSHHILHVLRMRDGDRIRIADTSEQMFFSSVSIEGKQVTAYIEQSIKDHTKGSVHITLAQGLIKKEKWDFLLQKSAELGVDEILPFISSRTVVKSKEEKADKKQQRYEKILLEACEQCKRSSKVLLHPTVSFRELTHKTADLKLIAYEDADQKSDALYDVVAQFPAAKNIIVAIGSEGGFSEEEVAYLEAAGYQRVSLGARILRAETAAMTVLAQLSFFYDHQGVNTIENNL